MPEFATGLMRGDLSGWPTPGPKGCPFNYSLGLSRDHGTFAASVSAVANRFGVDDWARRGGWCPRMHDDRSYKLALMCRRIFGRPPCFGPVRSGPVRHAIIIYVAMIDKRGRARERALAGH